MMKPIPDQPFAQRATVDEGPQYYTFEVAPEMVEANRDWSQPVRFRFDEPDGHRVQMWLQNVERPVLEAAAAEALSALEYIPPWALGPHELERRDTSILRLRAALEGRDS